MEWRLLFFQKSLAVARMRIVDTFPSLRGRLLRAAVLV